MKDEEKEEYKVAITVLSVITFILVWNDITESYEWEHYSDYNYTLMSKR